MRALRMILPIIFALAVFSTVNDRPLIEGLPELMNYAKTGYATVYFGSERTVVHDIPDDYWRYCAWRNRLP